MRPIINQASHAIFSVTYTTTIRSIIALSHGDVTDNVVVPFVNPSGPKWWQGLAIGVTALKAACDGELEKRRNMRLTRIKSRMCTETRALTALVHVIVSAKSDSSLVSAKFSNALEFINKHQCWNQFVWAYRAYPDLLRTTFMNLRIKQRIASCLVSARDEPLATRYGIDLSNIAPSQRPIGNELTRRERVVLHLVAEGLSNREVACKLFISEVTVKVHLRHIFKKLGVRNRTEAACHAVYSD